MKEEDYVSDHELGIVRIFLVLDPVRTELANSSTLDALSNDIGATSLDPAHVQLVETRALSDFGLQDLLADGYGIAVEELDAHKQTLDGVQEDDFLLAIVRSPAFTVRPVELAIDASAHLVATLHEPNANVSFKPLPNPDPEAVLEDAPQKKTPSDAAMGGRIATLALIVMGVLVWLMIKIAG